MINLPDATSIRAALRQPLEAQIHQLLAKRFADATAHQLTDMTHLLVIQPGDLETAIVDAIGFSPIGAEAPAPDWRERHPGYYELVYCVGNAGFAFVMFVQDAYGVLPDLLRFCRSIDDGGR